MSDKISAIVLAAGCSSRMGDQNKLLLTFHNQAMVSHVIDQLVGSGVSNIIVVTGNDFDAVTKSINQKVEFTHNIDYKDGLSSSLKAGISALPNTADGVMVCLADMPYITSHHYNQLLASFEKRKIIVPMSNGKVGNPLVFSKKYFHLFEDLTGDRGARELLQKYSKDVIKVDLGTDAIFNDVDTPDVYQEIMDKLLV